MTQETNQQHAIRSRSGQGRVYESILDTMGNTPVVKVNRLAPAHVSMFVKAEYFNPGGSVKDRLAINIIEQAEQDGRLKPGQTVVEATSGNTGIGLAMVCAAKGYPLVIVMAESFSIERRKLMRFLGARVVLTPRAGKAMGMYRKAQELAQANGWFLARQFETSANADIHEATTGHEILGDFSGKALDYWVTGYGTGGTVSGVARVLRQHRPATKIILSEPENAALIASGIAQLRDADHSPAGSHPAWQPHLIQGWTPDFVPWVLQEAIDQKHYDQILPVTSQAGIEWSRKLASQEGIITGISGGATFATAIEVAQTAPPGSTILCMLPDTAERYLSSPLFADIGENMNEEETAIAASTPGFQLGG
jgi:cysteine synthase A